MMHRAVFQSSVRRMRHAANQTELCRSLFSSTTNTTTAGGGNRATNNPNNAKNSVAAPFSSTAIDIATSKASGSYSSSIGSVGSIGSSVYGARNTDTSSSSNSNSTFNNSVKSYNYSSNAGNSSNNDDGGSGSSSSSSSSSSSELRSVYVHPLSQVVLEYLQDSRHQWIVANGLDRSLTLHRDGSFEVKYVPPPSLATSLVNDKNNKVKSAEPVISTSTSTSATVMMNHENNNIKTKARSNETSSSTATTSDSNTTTGPAKQQQPAPAVDNNIRIWTSYDEQEKKHWLMVRKDMFRQRFLLQDNLLTAWQGNRGTSLPERIHVAVDEMIRAVDRLEEQGGMPENNNNNNNNSQRPPPPAMGSRQIHQQGQRRFRKR